MDDKMMVGGCDAQVRGMDLTWLDLRFLMLSIPQAENKRGVKAEATPERVREIRINLPKSSSTSVGARATGSWLENIAFYQKCGFRMFEIRRDYFAYIQPPVVENGILLRDMLVLRYDVE